MVHPVAQKYPGLVNQIYNGFASRGYLNKTYITVDDCAAALVRGCTYHQGKGEVGRFLRKTISRIDKRSAKTHIGTFAQLNAVTTQKVNAAKALALANAEKQRAAEKARLEAQLKTLRGELQTKQKALTTCQQTIKNLNAEIAALNNQITICNRQIDRYETSITSLTAQLAQTLQNAARHANLFSQFQNVTQALVNENNALRGRLTQLQKCVNLQQQQQVLNNSTNAAIVAINQQITVIVQRGM
jgi:chromosome segregation ATPase